MTVRPYALLLATLLLPLVSAGPSLPLLAELTASSVEASGEIHLTGAGRAFLYRSQQETDHPRFDLTLTARHVHLEVDHSQSVARVGNITNVESTYPWTDSGDYDDVTVSAIEARPLFELDALILDDQGATASLTTSCLGITPPVTQRIEADKWAHTPREIPSVPSTGTIQAVACPGQAVLRGDFTLVVWEIDLELATPHGRTSLHTGDGMGPARGPDGAVAPANVPQMDQAYLIVTDGVLVLDRPPASDGSLDSFLEAGLASVDGSLHAVGPRGRLAGVVGQPEASGRLDVKGVLQARLAAQNDDRLTLGLFGSPDAVTLNGNPLQVATTPAPLPEPTPWTALLVLAGLLVLAALAVLTRRIMAARRRHARKPAMLALGLSAFESGRLRLALRLTNRALRAQASPDGYALKARVLFELRRWEEAKSAALLAEPLLQNAEHGAKNALLLSLASLELDQRADVRAWFRRAGRLHPPTCHEALERDDRLRAALADLGRGFSFDDLVRP